MQTETLLYIILAGIVAILLAVFQYIYKEKSTSRLGVLFAFLRFITVFSILLLLINPSIDKLTTYVEKPKLVVAVDNSSSITHLKQDQKTRDFLKQLKDNDALNATFNLEFYTFGESLKATDSFSFSEKQTNVDAAFTQLNQIYKQTTAPTLLISDGNQTFGNDYQFAYHQYKQPIFPVILGDTIKYTDLKIDQLNVNKYAYYKNKFPVEAILVYSGNAPVNSKFLISQGNNTLYSENLNFSKTNNSKVVNFYLPANTIGTGNYKASITPLEREKNKINNHRNFTVEVLNQKTKIAIVSDITHPDIGAFKKSIESNEQRSVSILNSKSILNQINDFQLFIIYQPNNSFKSLFDELKELEKNQFIIIGPKTDINFINTISENYKVDTANQLENYQAEFNRNFSPFIVQDIGFESFPPLMAYYGGVSFSVPAETILNKTVRGISTGAPLLSTFEINNRRQAVLFGENVWQWRAQSFLKSKSFNEFDNFMGKLIQYLASAKQKSRLNIEYESFYNGNSSVVVKAEYFNKNYVFDSRESLSIAITNEETNETKTLPFILKNNNFQVDLSGLPASKYTFTVRADSENLSKSGRFQILEYFVEQQFLNANTDKLEQLAKNSGGKSYYIAGTQDIVNDLLNDSRFVAVQKSTTQKTALIDWQFLLFMMAFSLALEWFVRKHFGLI